MKVRKLQFKKLYEPLKENITWVHNGEIAENQSDREKILKAAREKGSSSEKNVIGKLHSVFPTECSYTTSAECMEQLLRAL